jgi:2'-deoxynucleoside 5'-phosphate N-hydrolase
VRVYLAVKYHPDMGNRPLIEALDRALAELDMTSVCAVRDLERWGEVGLEPADLMRETFRLIDSCDLVLLELSEKGVGLGVEAGYAHARGKPVHVVARRGSDISATLRGVAASVGFYDMPALALGALRGVS